MPVRKSSARTWEMHFSCDSNYSACLDVLQRKSKDGFAIESVHGSAERRVISITWSRKEVSYKTAHAYCQYHHTCSTYTYRLLPKIGEASTETMCEVQEAEDSQSIIAPSQTKTASRIAAEPDDGVVLSFDTSESAPSYVHTNTKKRKKSIDASSCYTAAEAATQLRSLLLTDTGTILSSSCTEAQRLRILACGLGLLDKVPEKVIKEVGEKKATKVFSAVLITLAFGWEGIRDEDHERAEEELRNRLNIQLSNKAMLERFKILKCVVANCVFGHSDWYI